jgi:hypothetical protein
MKGARTLHECHGRDRRLAILQLMNGSRVPEDKLTRHPGQKAPPHTARPLKSGYKHFNVTENLLKKNSHAYVLDVDTCNGR